MAMNVKHEKQTPEDTVESSISNLTQLLRKEDLPKKKRSKVAEHLGKIRQECEQTMIRLKKGEPDGLGSAG